MDTAGREFSLQSLRLKVHFIVPWESLLFRCKDSGKCVKITLLPQIYITFRQIRDRINSCMDSGDDAPGCL